MITFFLRLTMWCDPQAKVFTDDLKTQTEDIIGVKLE